MYKLTNQKGFTSLFVIGIVCVASILMLCGINSIGTAAFQQKLFIDQLNRKNSITHIKPVVTALAINKLSKQSNQFPKKENIESALKWSLNTNEVLIESVNTQTISTPPKSTFCNLLGSLMAQTSELTTYKLKIANKHFSCLLEYAKVPITEVELFCPFGLYLEKISIPLEVNGTCVANGIQNNSSSHSFACKKMFTPFIAGVNPANFPKD